MTSIIRLASYLISLLVSLILFNVVSSSSNVDPDRKLYIVYMGSRPEEGDYSPREQHESILQNVITDNSVRRRALRRSYGRTFDGFAAWLTDLEREKLNNMREVLSIFPSYNLELHTIRSWDFLGLSENVTQSSVNGSDVIIGVLDSGIWAGSESFSDEGFGPVPTKWKGACKGGLNFTCNRKIIGARFYGTNQNVTDDDGHGTHTASTAAGNMVKRVNYHDIAKGTVRGGLPGARIAVYKVCGSKGCPSADILAAFDDVIADGVDVITISIGHTSHVELTHDVTAIGSFHALVSGITTVNSAGNSGDRLGTITQLAPWVISVGASTTDRIFVDKLILGNGKTFKGNNINSFLMSRNPEVTLTYGGKNTTSCNETQVKKCSTGCLDEQYVKGKIVVCESFRLMDNLELLQKGAAGLITQSSIEGYTLRFPISAIVLTPAAFDQVQVYINTTLSPKATIRRSRSAKDPIPPRVARFSSRGPNRLFPDTMKPDVVAPGVQILAAYPPYIPPTQGEKSLVTYNFKTGTSMACPHVAGAIAYIKSQHPNWSPSALKSALMTSARSLNASMHSDREFAYGSGLIDPIKAADPGLIYDISKNDYLNIICSVYDAETCHNISGKPCQCSGQKLALTDLNYPSMTVKVNASSMINVTFTRVVINVGANPTATYNAEVTIASKNLMITVVPNTLSFKELNEKKSFKVSVTGEYPQKEVILSSSLMWSDGTHKVRSPIVLYT